MSTTLKLKLNLLVAREAVMKCSEKFGFKGEEAWSEVEKELLADVDVKVKKIKKAAVPSLLMPFEPSMVRKDLCQALCYNRGLFTQCQKKYVAGEEFCTSCLKEATSQGGGKPLAGTVEDRLACDLMDYRDNKGRAVIAYQKVLGKKKDETMALLNDQGIVLSDVHLEEYGSGSIEEKKRGRPKKEALKIETEVVDLFAALDISCVHLEPDAMMIAESHVEKEEEKKEEEEEKKQPPVKEAKAKPVKAAVKEPKVKEPKVKEAKAKEAKVKEPKLKEPKAKEAKAKPVKATKEQQQEPLKEPIVAPALKEEEEPNETKVKVSEFEWKGVKYLKTTSNQLFDIATHEEIGFFNEKTGEIEEVEEEEEEQEEEGYESD